MARLKVKRTMSGQEQTKVLTKLRRKLNPITRQANGYLRNTSVLLQIASARLPLALATEHGRYLVKEDLSLALPSAQFSNFKECSCRREEGKLCVLPQPSMVLSPSVRGCRRI